MEGQVRGGDGKLGVGGGGGGGGGGNGVGGGQFFLSFLG